MNTVKALLCPRRAYLLFAVLDGGLNRAGTLKERQLIREGACYKCMVNIYGNVLVHFFDIS